MPLVGEAKREYQRNWVASRKSQWFAGKSCVTCGSFSGLEINHIDRAKKVSHRVWSWSTPRRDEELTKCEVLCHACHKEVTRKQFSKPIQHGTKSGYNRGCRLECCMEGMRKYFRDYRNRS